MKDYRRNHFCQDTGTRVKKNNDENQCTCSSPFTNLHCHECPLAKLFCPVHGDTKSNKPSEGKERMVISFHPNKKTDKLLQPIKCILGSNYDAETKINFQYFSPENLSTTMLKNRHIQTNPEDLKINSGSCDFAEKTKSYVAGKASRMKKLNFRSPNPEKTKSQTALKEELTRSSKGLVRESRSQENKKPNTSVFFYCCDKPPPSDAEKSGGMSDSDCFTVIRDVKTVKELKAYDNRSSMPFFTSKGNQTQFAFFSTIESENQGSISLGREKDNETNDHGSDKEQHRGSEESSSEKLQSDSSRSVYFTPFILVPKGRDMGDSGSDPKAGQSESHRPSKETQAKEPSKEEIQPIVMSTCSSPFLLVKDMNQESEITKMTKTDFEKEQRQSYTSQKSKELSRTDFKSLILELVKEIKSSETSKTNDKYTQYPSKQEVPTSGKLSNQSQFTVPISGHSSLHVIMAEEEETTSEEKLKTLSKQNAQSHLRRSTKSTASSPCVDKDCQTDAKSVKDVEVEMIKHKANKYQMTSPLVSVVAVQTQIIKIDKGTQTDYFQVPEFIDLNNPDSSTLTYVKKSFLSQESELDMQKLSLLSQKFHSDGELHASTKEKDIPLQPVQKEDVNSKNKEGARTSKNSEGIDVILDAPGTRETKPSRKVETREDGINTSFSDLSELRKIINEHFDKMFTEAMKSQAPRSNRGTQTDPKSDSNKNAEAQTSAGLVSETKICLKCTTETNEVVDVGTLTDDTTKTNKSETYYECVKIKTVKSPLQQNKADTTRVPNKPATPTTSKVEKDTPKNDKPIPAPRRSVTSRPEFSRNFETSQTRPRQVQAKPENPTKDKLVSSRTRNVSFSQQPKAITLDPTLPKDCICEEVLKQTSRYPMKGSIPTFGLERPKTITMSADLKAKTIPADLRQKTIPADFRPKTTQAEYKPKTTSAATKPKTTPAVPKPKGPGDPKPKGPVTYPVAIQPVWPENLTVAKSIPNYPAFPTAAKRNLVSDDDLETPNGKKVKNDKATANSQKCFVFGKDEQQETATSSSGFMWTASTSAPLFSGLREDMSCSCNRALKSEEQLKSKTNLKTPSADFSNLFSVKSFHHTNMNVIDKEESVRKLFECSFCKSLSYLKPRKKLNETNPRRSVGYKSMFGLTESLEELVEETVPPSDRSGSSNRRVESLFRGPDDPSGIEYIESEVYCESDESIGSDQGS